MKKLTPWFICSLPALLAACGGGGDNSTGSTSSLKQTNTDSSVQDAGGVSSTNHVQSTLDENIVALTPSGDAMESTGHSTVGAQNDQSSQIGPSNQNNLTDKRDATRQFKPATQLVLGQSKQPTQNNSLTITDDHGLTMVKREPDRPVTHVFIKEAMANLLDTGLTKNIRIEAGFFKRAYSKRDAYGTMQLTIARRSDAMFHNTKGFGSFHRLQVTEFLPNTSQRVVAEKNWTDFYDAELGYLGSRSENAYCVAKPGGKYPETVKEGDVGNIGTAICYASDKSHVPIGTHTISYRAEHNPSGGLNFHLQTTIKNDVTHTQFTMTEGHWVPVQGDASLLGLELRYVSPQGESFKVAGNLY